MKVKRDFEALYRRDSDPWKIGRADSDRYDRYFDLISPHARGLVLDIGSGTGAFLARCEARDTRLIGVEVSATAVRQGRAQFPHIEFFEGSAERLDEIGELQALREDGALTEEQYARAVDRILAEETQPGR
jgi:SAM-dependent methyltransferase